MNDFKIIGKCTVCKKKRFFIRNQSLVLPTGLEVKSMELMCSGCIKKIRGTIH